MKKAITLFLALTLALMMALPVMAEGTGKGTITIEDAVVGQKYTIYRILDLESYSGEAYAYKATTAWASFIEDEKISNIYLKVNEDGYVEWVGDSTAASAEAFAKLAKEYLEENTSIAHQGTVSAITTTVTFTDLDLGYYLVDSTLGALCSLDTTNPVVTMHEKNKTPESEKTVEEDSTGDYGKTNDADIGQTVKFKNTITVNANNQNYVFHDKMSAGLTYSNVTGITKNDTLVDESDYTVQSTDLTDDCTFEVVFTEAFCNELQSSDVIVIEYTATLNENAVVGVNGNTNESKLQYGAEGSTSTTPLSITTTYTWDVDVLKYANSDESKVLVGVKFALLNSDKTKAATVKNGKVTGWATVPTGDNAWPQNTILITGSDGKISIDGLDADTYYLREIETLPGYNKLAGDVPVTVTGKTTGEDGKVKYETLVVEVNNNSGVEMPSTGGIGTTIFYVAGGLLVAVAVVLLVTKKKMSATK